MLRTHDVSRQRGSTALDWPSIAVAFSKLRRAEEVGDDHDRDPAAREHRPSAGSLSARRAAPQAFSPQLARSSRADGISSPFEPGDTVRRPVRSR